MDEKELKILMLLRRNARISLTDISRKTDIPVSTVFDKIKKIEKKYLLRYTTLLDFNGLGSSIRLNILLEYSDNKKNLVEFIKENININTAYRINPGSRFYVEGIFRNMIQLNDFFKKLENMKVKKIDEHYILEEIKKEGYLR